MPPLGSIRVVSSLLDGLEVGPPARYGALTVVPLLAPGEAEPDWLTLAEAGAAVTIAEVGAAGEAPALSVTNAADRPVLLLDGDELAGAGQLNGTILVGAHATLRVPLSRVEQGYRGARLHPGDASPLALARARKAVRVSAVLRELGGPPGDAGASPAGPIRGSYRRADDIAATCRALALRPGQVGAAVSVADRWAGLDLLPTPGLFARAWPTLCAGYAAEGLGRRPSSATPDVRALLARLAALPAEPAPAVGLGEELRIATQDAAGAALVIGDRLAHLMVFPVLTAGA
jgi:hypothetical protein